MDFPDPKRLPEKSDGDDAYTHQIRGSNAKKKRDALLVEAVRRAAKGEKNGDLCLPGLSLGDDGVARVCEIAAGRTIVTLGAVDLSDNDVRERGAAALADAILAARGLSGAARSRLSLSALHLDANPGLGLRGLESIARVLRHPEVREPSCASHAARRSGLTRPRTRLSSPSPLSRAGSLDSPSRPAASSDATSAS